MHQAAVEHFSSEDGWDMGHQRTLVSSTVYYIRLKFTTYFSISSEATLDQNHVIPISFLLWEVFVIILRFEDKMDPTLFDMLVNIWTAMAVNFFACWLLCTLEMSSDELTSWSQELAQRSVQKENLGPALVSLCQAHSFFFKIDPYIFIHLYISYISLPIYTSLIYYTYIYIYI